MYVNNGVLDHEGGHWGTFDTLAEIAKADYDSLVENYKAYTKDYSDDDSNGNDDNVEHPDDYMYVRVHDPRNTNERYMLPGEDTHAIALMLSSINDGQELTYAVREGYEEVYDCYGKGLWRDRIDNLRTFRDQNEALRYIIKDDRFDDAMKMLNEQSESDESDDESDEQSDV